MAFNHHHATRISIGLLLAGVAIAALMLCFYKLRADADWRRRLTTVRALDEFEFLASGWAIANSVDQLPCTFNELANAIKTDPQWRQRWMRDCKVYRFLPQGCDAWNTPLMYKITSDGKQAVVISAGENLRYDEGQGDDVMVKISLLE